MTERSSAKRDQPTTVELRNRLSLRAGEAAQVLGISERTLRHWLPRLPHIREGNVLLFPVDQLRAWLSDRVRQQEEEAQRLASELMAELGR